MEDHERRRADALFESVFGYFFKASKTRSRTYPIMETLTGLALAAVLFWGGQQVLNGETTVGKFMTFFAALVMAYQPLRSLANLNASLQEGLAAAERIFSMIDYRSTIAARPDAQPLRLEQSRIELQDAHFAYQAGKSAPTAHTLDLPATKPPAPLGTSSR